MTPSEYLAYAAQRLREAPEIVNMALRDILSSDTVKDYMITLIQTQLYQHQIDAYGNDMPEYTPWTKRKYRKPCDRYNLYHRGDLYEGMDVIVGDSGIDFTSDVPYAADYAYAIGLTPDSVQKLKAYIQEPLYGAIENYIFQQ